MINNQIRKVLVIGSGPIVIGQAAEFDYAGTQACKAIREEGISVVLVNSNPATIQTDLETADTVYLEPLTKQVITEVIRKEKPDAVLATMSGQTGLNLALELSAELAQNNVKMLGTPLETISLAEDREKFSLLMKKIGEPVAESIRAKDLQETKDAAKKIGVPVILRPDYCLGGSGTAIVRNESELEKKAADSLSASQTQSVLVEKSLEGLTEIEYEVIRDAFDNCITICSMENLDAVGVHTGESIVVAPVQTLSDYDLQALRFASIKIVRALGVIGACNIQFAFNHANGEYWIIEVNPRTSRSSALASKVTGYPIARIATKLALGYALTELKNSITGKTACFEPSLDYLVVKIPRWPFDKLGGSTEIGTSMKSTGEAMGIGKTFEEALCKAVRSLEAKRGKNTSLLPCEERLYNLIDALKTKGIEEASSESMVHPWFLHKLKNLKVTKTGLVDYVNYQEKETVFNSVDTCGGEIQAFTPYYYSTQHSQENEVKKTQKRKILILGSGPIRIGQGIEFDYSTVHAISALKEKGFEAIVVNNNPETVSTDFDVSNKLYFEPLTVKDVNRIMQEEENLEGVLVQFGGQTALNLAKPLESLGAKILGTSTSSLDAAGDRKQFKAFSEANQIKTVKSEVASSLLEIIDASKNLSYPILLRPSHVLGGRAMFVVKNQAELEEKSAEVLDASPGHPVILDEFLQDATEVDVDCLGDGKNCFIAGIMEQIEEAGIHSGDSACVIPTQSLSLKTLEKIREYAIKIVTGLEIKGFCNIQIAVKNEEPYVIEVNPRASRTIPFVSKAINLPLAKIAALIQANELTLSSLPAQTPKSLIAVKVPVFPFNKFPSLDPVLSPEMKSTGETMCFGTTFAEAYLKALNAAGQAFGQKVLLTSADSELEKILSENGGLTVIKATGEDALSKIGGADFVVSLPASGDLNTEVRKQCIRMKKTLVTSKFAAMAIAKCLNEKPAFKLISLNQASEEKLAYA